MNLDCLWQFQVGRVKTGNSFLEFIEKVLLDKYLKPVPLGGKWFRLRDKGPGHALRQEGDGALFKDRFEGEVKTVSESSLDAEGQVAGRLEVAGQRHPPGICHSSRIKPTVHEAITLLR